MNTARWEQVSNLYRAALALDPSQRAALLREAGASDPELQREVKLLLAQAESTASVKKPTGSLEELPVSGGTTLIGRQLGVYLVMAKLGAGGMGEVYRARDPRLGRDVAIKILPAAFTNDADRLARFEREARVLAALNHPNVGAIY